MWLEQLHRFWIKREGAIEKFVLEMLRMRSIQMKVSGRQAAMVWSPCKETVNERLDAKVQGQVETLRPPIIKGTSYTEEVDRECRIKKWKSS